MRSKLKVLVADRLSAGGLKYFEGQSDVTAVTLHGSRETSVEAEIVDADALVVRSATRVTASLIDRAEKLRVIGRAGVGVDNIDVDAATRKGIIVLNAPEGNAVATAELAFTHILSTARPVPQASASVHGGRWEREAFPGTELFRKTLGVLGLGRVGGEVAKRALAFGMRVIAYDPYVSTERAHALQVESVDLDVVLSDADFITVHLPLTEATAGLLDDRAFAKMKHGVRLVNCARGGIVDEPALVKAILSGKVAAAGLDVFESEPLPADSPLLGLPNLVLSPHLGASTREAQESVGVEVASAVVAALRGEVVRNAVNMPAVDAQTLKVLRPYLTLAAKLGSVLQQISPAQIESIRITYWGGIVDLDTRPVTRAVQSGFLRRICQESVNDVNAPHFMKRMGIEISVVNSSSASDFTELVRVEAIEPGGGIHLLEGTLIGTGSVPRITRVNGSEVEVDMAGHLLFLENRDIPGIVGVIGTILGRHGVNIAKMSLSRGEFGGVALTALELDSPPDAAAVSEIAGHEAIVNVQRVEV